MDNHEIPILDHPDTPEADGKQNKKRQKNQKQKLIELASTAELFRTPEGTAWASVWIEDHSENWPIKSTRFESWLRRRFFLKFKDAPSTTAMKDAVATIESRALFAAPTQPVYTRVAELGSDIFIDLADDGWQAVRISAHGWQIVSDPPVRFRRSAGMLSLPSPQRGGRISLRRKYINLDPADQDGWALLLSWLVAALRPRGPYPILILQGAQGSAKSTNARMLRRLIDPFSAPLRTTPRDERDLMIAANNSWLLSYDNVSGIHQWLSDALCRIATGGGLTTRKLYTDQDETILDVQRPMTINGIDQLAERPDLADRAITLNLPRIDPCHRRDEETLFLEFECDRPAIFGALLDAIVVALRRLPQVNLSASPRMADFTRWAAAAETGLGFAEGTFMRAYDTNRDEGIETIFESDAFAAALRDWAIQLSEEGWEGISEGLRKLIDSRVDEGTRKSTGWPKNAKTVSSRLRRLASTFREIGIEIKMLGKRTGGRRVVAISKV